MSQVKETYYAQKAGALVDWAGVPKLDRRAAVRESLTTHMS